LCKQAFKLNFLLIGQFKHEPLNSSNFRFFEKCLNKMLEKFSIFPSNSFNHFQHFIISLCLLSFLGLRDLLYCVSVCAFDMDTSIQQLPSSPVYYQNKWSPVSLARSDNKKLLFSMPAVLEHSPHHPKVRGLSLAREY